MLYDATSERAETPVADAAATTMQPARVNSLTIEAEGDDVEHEPLFVRCNDTQKHVAASRAIDTQEGRNAAGISPPTAVLGTSSSHRSSIVVEDYDSDAATNILGSTAIATTTTGIPVDIRADPAAPTSGAQETPATDDTADDGLTSGATTQLYPDGALAGRRTTAEEQLAELVRTESVGRLANADSQGPRTGLVKKKSGFMNEIRDILARRTSKPDATSPLDKKQQGDEDAALRNSGSAKAVDAIKADYQRVSYPVNPEGRSTMMRRVQERCDRDTQTLAPSPVLTVDEATSTDEPGLEMRPEDENTPAELSPAVQELVQRKLLDMRTVR